MNTHAAPAIDQDGGPRGHAVSTHEKPYVVSLDIVPLLRSWTTCNGFVLPEDSFFDRLRANMRGMLSTMFDPLVIIGEDEIRPNITRIARSLHLPVVSLDHAYCPIGTPLNVTRAVHADMTSAGLTHRGSSCTIEEQVGHIAAHLQGDVVLVDDVIFTGEMLARDVIPTLRRRGITVRAVVAGITIGAGLRRVQEEVEDVRYVRMFPDVVDEICERDFYPGVPLSGRTVLGAENTGMPYLRPFGDPNAWASIPSACVDAFSRFCIDETIVLFEAIERASAKHVRMCDLRRGVHSLPTGQERFVDELLQARERI